jgi:2,3-dihydroxybenzoate decarboxylase
VALEEHFVIPDLRGCIASVGWSDEEWQKVIAGLEDIEGTRLTQMDELGIEMCVLSLGSDGIQSISDPDEAAETARTANRELAEIVARRPDRFAGLAALPMQDPAVAADELTRCVNELGFKGALVNGYSDLSDGGGAYYDQAEYLPFWETVADLEVPFYLHPRNPMPDQRGIYGTRTELLGPTWAFAVETGTHALRMITSGLFDRLPRLQVILGHQGEQLPFAIARLEQRLAHNPAISLERGPRQVLRENFHLTTSGNSHTPSLIGAMLEVGADRILFSADYPFERMADGAEWFDALPVSAGDLRKMGRTNADRLLKLGLDQAG